MEQAYNLEQELNLLDPRSIRIYIDEFGDLTLEMEGGKVRKPVTAIRAFPVTAIDHFIVLKDSDGKEIGTIQAIADLDSKSRRELAAELERAYFTPKITQINEITEMFHIPKWDVETDRGPKVFEMRSGRDLRELGGGRLILRDADGNRYEIPDYRKLDAVSISIIETRI